MFDLPIDERCLLSIRLLDKQTLVGIHPVAMHLADFDTTPLTQQQVLDFTYKHSTGPIVGRFLAGLKEQKQIWGQRVRGGAVVVPPVGYSEWDGSEGLEWVPVSDRGTVVAVARVREPVAQLHPFSEPFAYVLIRLDGADTALLHVVRTDHERVRIGSRVTAVWKADDARVGSILDIDEFRLTDES